MHHGNRRRGLACTLSVGALIALWAWPSLAQAPLQTPPPPACDKPVYLTFDTGHMGVAALIAGVLNRHRVKATFFLANERTLGGGSRKSGAVDFLPKRVKDKVLLAAVEQTLVRAERELGERAELASVQRRLASLTPRELEVMALVVRGFLNKQIAFELGTVEKTVKVHRARVMEKMEVQSLAELVRMAERVGFGEA